ncbi:MAG: TRAP transporter substrate-binding protein [Propionibacterium sp.]|nr:TRAP transporter substrate-binding protein [Propionibacterium sp.]
MIKLKLAMVDNESTPYYKGAQKIAEEVKAATDGRVEIQINAGGLLGDERGTVEMAMNGDVDIATAANSVMTNWIPEMSVLEQAFLWDNADQAHAAVDGPVGELIEKAAEAQGVHVIGYMESGFRNTFSKDPITSIDDFSGVKIRTMQSPAQLAAFESFGAMPVALPAGEQFTALQQGTIDAAENATVNMQANRFYEVIKNHTTTEHNFVYILLVMSDKAWQSIPDDVRPAFLEGVQAGYQAEREYLVEANTTAADELKSNGVQFHDIDRAALKAAYEASPTVQAFTYDPEWVAAVDEAKASH